MTAEGLYTCPKCGGEMKSGTTAGDFRILKEGDLMGDRANVLYCTNCGYIEQYKEPSTKEPKRWQTPPPSPEQTTPSEEPQEPQEETEPKRRTEKRLIR